MKTISETSGTTLNAPTFKLQGSQKKRRRKGLRKYLKRLVENFPNIGKETVIQVQEAQRVPYVINPRKNTPRHILIKLTKIKFKEKILKGAREKQKNNIQRIPITLSADFSVEILQARMEWQNILKVMKEKNLQPRLLYPRLPWWCSG